MRQQDHDDLESVRRTMYNEENIEKMKKRRQQAESQKWQRMRLSQLYMRLHTDSVAPISVFESSPDEGKKDHGNTEETQEIFDSEDPALVSYAAS